MPLSPCLFGQQRGPNQPRMGRPKVIGAWVWDRRVPCKTVDRPVPLASSGRKHVGQLGVGVFWWSFIQVLGVKSI